MGEEQNIFSDNQRNTIYEDMLKPIKLKISEILLYDPETAMKFLQEYDDIVNSTQDKDILEKITDLELKIDSYEKNNGKKKSFALKSDSIIQQIKDMQTDGHKLSLEQYEEEFETLKTTYKSEVSGYSIAERDKIEKILYELYGNLMVRRVREGSVDEIQIPEEDTLGLTIYLNGQIDKLSEDATPQVKNVLERIKFKLMSGKETFKDDEIWKLLSYAQGNTHVRKQESFSMQNENPKVTALTIAKKRNSFLKSLKRKFTREPVLPLQEEDLDKITLEWLSHQIPEGMRREYEEARLKKEGKTKQTLYLPFSKQVIIDELESRCNHGLSISDGGAVAFKDKDGCEQCLKMYQEGNVFTGNKFEISITPVESNVVQKQFVKIDGDIYSIVYYMIFIDKVMTTHFFNQFVEQLTQFMNNQNKSTLQEKEYKLDRLKFKIPILSKILKSYNKIIKEARKEEKDVRHQDIVARDNFYKKNELSENLSQDKKKTIERHEQRQEVDQAMQVGDDSITPAVEEEEDRG